MKEAINTFRQLHNTTNMREVKSFLGLFDEF